MARASDHFRQSDVTFWGCVSLVTAGIAVFGSNVSAVAPSSVVNALHAPRTGSTSLDGLRAQVSDLRSDIARVSRDYQVLIARADVQEKSGGDVVRRVGALELSLPKFADIHTVEYVDRTSLTASIGAVEELPAEGGTVSVRQMPLPALQANATPEEQALPAPIVSASRVVPPNPIPYGVTIGGFMPEVAAPVVWEDLQLKIGALLLEFSPLISEPTEQGTRILVGPMETLAEARKMCERLERIAFSCLPVSYEGREFLTKDTHEGG